MHFSLICLGRTLLLSLHPRRYIYTFVVHPIFNCVHILKDITFNRCYYRAISEVIQTELHGFCDASEDAYAAVVYIGATYKEGPPTLVLVIAKTKVAPLKRQSIPWLCGAQLLAKLLSNVRNALQIGISNCYAWTDSLYLN